MDIVVNLYLDNQSHYFSSGICSSVAETVNLSDTKHLFRKFGRARLHANGEWEQGRNFLHVSTASLRDMRAQSRRTQNGFGTPRRFELASLPCQ